MSAASSIRGSSRARPSSRESPKRRVRSRRLRRWARSKARSRKRRQTSVARIRANHRGVQFNFMANHLLGAALDGLERCRSSRHHGPGSGRSSRYTPTEAEVLDVLTAIVRTLYGWSKELAHQWTGTCPAWDETGRFQDEPAHPPRRTPLTGGLVGARSGRPPARSAACARRPVEDSRPQPQDGPCRSSSTAPLRSQPYASPHHPPHDHPSRLGRGSGAGGR